MYHAMTGSELREAIVTSLERCPSQQDRESVEWLRDNRESSFDSAVDTFVQQCIDLNNDAYVDDCIPVGPMETWESEYDVAARYRDRTLLDRPIRMNDLVMVTAQVFAETLLPGMIGAACVRGLPIDEASLDQMLVVGAIQVSIKMRKYLKKLMRLPPFANEMERCVFLRAEVNFGISRESDGDDTGRPSHAFTFDQLFELYNVAGMRCDAPFMRQWKCDVLYDADRKDVSMCGLASDGSRGPLENAVEGLVKSGYFHRDEGEGDATTTFYVPFGLGRMAA